MAETQCVSKRQSAFRYEEVFPLRRGVGTLEPPEASPREQLHQVSESPVVPHLISKGTGSPGPAREANSTASDSDDPPPLIEEADLEAADADPVVGPPRLAPVDFNAPLPDFNRIMQGEEIRRRERANFGTLLVSRQWRQDEKEVAQRDSEKEEYGVYCDDAPIRLSQLLRLYDAAEIEAHLANFLSEVRNGKLDSPTALEAQAYAYELRKSCAWALSFKETLRQWGIQAEELPMLLEGSAAERTFAFYLPKGALSWSTLGAYPCETCYMPLQRKPVAYAQHMIGEPHLTRLQRFVGYLETTGPSEFLLCKICLKVIDPGFSVEEHNDSKKHKRAQETWLNALGSMAWSAQ